jgi:hypothetical protein
VKYTHIRESRRWFSVQRSHRGVAGTISLEIPGQASARPTSSAIGSSLDWCARRTCRSRNSARCAAANWRKWRPSCARSRWIDSAPSGGTRCSTSIRNRPLARSRHAPTDISIDKGARGYLHVAGGGGKWRKPADGSAACKKPAGGGLGHPAGKFLEGKAMHVAGMQVTGVHPAW